MPCCGQNRPEGTREHPVLLGDVDDTLVRAKNTITLGGLPAGSVGYFTGTHVATLVAQRALIPQT